ncbi:MAG: efflux RND transporter periplasmic adaptor subunit [Paludibacteraceae bacterium]|nr:efflux RND transporter periplasmic adaptor subunit [Paludibacteraceae bacterium]
MRNGTYCIIIALLFTACTQPVEQQIAPMLVSAQRIDSMAVVPSHTYVGELESDGTVSMAFQTTGRVVSLSVHAGDEVKENQVLAQLDDTQAKSALRAARTTLAQAEDGYRRTKTLYEKGGVAEIKYVEVKSQLDQARSMAALAEENLKHCTLRAPQNGVIGSVNLHIGEVVLPAAQVMTLLSDKALNAVFTVSESEIARIRQGEKGKVLVSAVGSEWMSGTVVEKSLVAGKIAHSYTVKMSMDDVPPYKEMMPGMVAKVQLDGQVCKGYLVPAHCVQTDKSGLLVWKISNGKATRQTVHVEQFAQSGVLVSEGLQCGDSVIIDGFQKLYEGAQVMIR